MNEPAHTYHIYVDKPCVVTLPPNPVHEDLIRVVIGSKGQEVTVQPHRSPLARVLLIKLTQMEQSGKVHFSVYRDLRDLVREEEDTIEGFLGMRVYESMLMRYNARQRAWQRIMVEETS